MSETFEFRSSKIDPLKKNTTAIKAKITDWYASNEVTFPKKSNDSDDSENSDDSDEDDEEKKKKLIRRYVIRIFATTKKGTSIGINVYNYTPHYFVKIPIDVSKNKYKLKQLVDDIKRKIPYSMRTNLDSYDIVMKKNIWGFTNNETIPFLRLIFKDISTMNNSVKAIKENTFLNGSLSLKDALFESNIPPFLRFIHKNKIEPAGWITIEPGAYKINLYDNKKTRCQVDIDVDNWKKIKSHQSDDIVPFITAVYDLECNSSHGDFPLAKKDYKKLAQEIYEMYHKYQDEERPDVMMFLNIAFGISENLSTKWDISKVYTYQGRKPLTKLLKMKSKFIHSILETKETYAILSHYIIKHVLADSSPDDIGIDESIILNMVCDSFADCSREDLETDTVKMYTKSNNKPTKKILANCSIQTSKVMKKLIYSLKKILIPEDIIAITVNYKETIKHGLSNITESTIEECNRNIDMANNQLIAIYQNSFPELDTTRETTINRIIDEFDIDHYNPNCFPKVNGDEIIQIGTVVQRYGEKDLALKHIVTLKSCSPIPGAIVESYNTEREVILAWIKFMNQLDPDVITGYNIFGFDYSYLWNRAEELELTEEMKTMGRIKGLESGLECKKLASSALGDNTLYYLNMHGRVQLDLLKVIQRDHNLVSYKLDYVAENFINDSIVEVASNNTLKIKGLITLYPGNFITIDYDTKSPNKPYKEKKYKILDIDRVNHIITLDVDDFKQSLLFSEDNKNIRWQLAKDDVSPKQIFEYQDQGPDKRSIVASYCIQDCALCINIINKLDIITNNIGMANVCFVPLSFIFLRGQGIKIFSLVAKECKEEDFLVPLIKYEREETNDTQFKINYDFTYKNEGEYRSHTKFEPAEDESDMIIDNDGGYEGAIVLKPQPGIYIESPVVVLDYASLYPSSMISENLSHDSIILDEKYLGDEGIKRLNKLGYSHVDITHDVYKWKDPNIKSQGKVKVGVKTCRFAQPPEGKKSVIPRILAKLLKARKDTRAKIKTTEDPFQKSVLDGLQMAYKTTANSLYGQLGARTSPIYMKDIAASTTATGRKLLYLAKDKTIEKFPDAEIVYGDTDSIFINYNPKDEDGNPIKNREGLKASIDMGVETEKYIQQFLKSPHKLEYEKTFWPFILLSKKRYIGNKYEFDLNKYSQTSMGIVLKRRDNADIVKHIYGTVIDILMNQHNLEKSIEFCRTACQNLLDGKFPLEMLIITKSLRGYYKNPDQIAHKVLANRIGEREPGNKPKSNDRIPFAYIETKESKNKKMLQGDKIEHPSYIREQNLKPDYKFYITNQIMKPVGQIYALTVENIKGYNKPPKYFENKRKALLETKTPDNANEKINDLRFKEATDLIFNEVLRVATNRKNNAREITDFFTVSKK
jgi:DNA polymerase elongation subunit (family B)